MVRFLVSLGLFITIALVVGFSLSYLALDRGMLFGTFRQGPWLTWKDVGSPRPDPYTLAYGARSGALFLTRAEGIRFVAKRDSDGQKLERNCAYRVDGVMPVSAFWTLVATDLNGELITKKGTPPAMQSQRLARTEDGSVLIRASPFLAAGNWLEIAGTGNFELVLTLYDTTVFSGFGSLDKPLPSISLEGCK